MTLMNWWMMMMNTISFSTFALTQISWNNIPGLESILCDAWGRWRSGALSSNPLWKLEIRTCTISIMYSLLLQSVRVLGEIRKASGLRARRLTTWKIGQLKGFLLSHFEEEICRRWICSLWKVSKPAINVLQSSHFSNPFVSNNVSKFKIMSFQES